MVTHRAVDYYTVELKRIIPWVFNSTYCFYIKIEGENGRSKINKREVSRRVNPLCLWLGKRDSRALPILLYKVGRNESRHAIIYRNEKRSLLFYLGGKMLGAIAQRGLNFRYQDKYVEAGKAGAW
ncbi:hypothetical protein TSTA_056740 [Talaromyces stipitatus ATCC 10500]|uniref:Uncharacterized protein n=1 Tax=Talaromyces stipitatus (strain ATCC 10500 / CBS 375.48 / QM 6759 / NRRL 1006) TaxID=441959 RepID=B8MRL7_TALSN|nr:uncharacterized protein TSTA_056740 [Talaromyces stipitatus ATCC 10500]EED13174.1 hypothetical protein TSTA_056740 [Talaromyces stipitatus ATCC 10500]